MMVRLPERRDQGEKDLQTIIADPKTRQRDRAPRAGLGTHGKKGIRSGQPRNWRERAELDSRDPWVHYYLALVKFRAAQSSRGTRFEGVSNMIQDLLVVLDWEPDFAEAHNMLAMARLAGRRCPFRDGRDTSGDPAQPAQ